MNQRMLIAWSIAVGLGQPPAMAPSPRMTRPAQIILIRHGEKPADAANPHLSRAGVERGKQLVTFIKTDPTIARFGLPVAVFATQTTKDGNGQRPVMSTPAYAGKTVVVCWNHEEIVQLAAARGIAPAPPKWKGNVFDVVYVISYRDGSAALTTLRYGRR